MNIYLFLGTETAYWSLDDFAIAANKAIQLGVTHLLVKVADGTHYWYGSIGGYTTVLNIIKKQGIHALPYMYSYGNTYNAFSIELTMQQSILQTVGSLVLDLEVEWNGESIWAVQLVNALRTIQGELFITTWADPIQQNWSNVLQILKERVNYWMPQVYSNYLANVYKEQFGNVAIIPIFNLGQDFGENALFTNVVNAKNSSVGFWHYQEAISSYLYLFQQIITYMKGTYMSNIPEGWSDDGSTLTAPNGVKIVLGFRQYILTHVWNPENTPLRSEYAANPVLLHNPSIGGGTRQEFRDCLLWWTAEKGVVQEPFLGLELFAAYQALEKH